MLLEVIATTLSDAVMAERYGADRIELITGISEGGLKKCAMLSLSRSG
ncbi:hypothetical protein [Paenibacillus sp. FSL F4-0243]